jgi:lipopolysaccharide/colanic/teichoic acid biosynthesis glycosyltransferase
MVTIVTQPYFDVESTMAAGGTIAQSPVFPPGRFSPPSPETKNRRPRAAPARFRRPSPRPDWLIRQRLAREQTFVGPQGNLSPAYQMVKRLLDIAGAFSLLVLLGPLLLAILLTLLVTTKGRPLFVQRRVGYLGRPFTMLKFRTMRSDAEQVKHAVANEKDGPIFKNRRDPRITRLGRFLRKTSLDETPQLLNVLCGHMSLVGPRPLPVGEVAQFRTWHCRRLAVKPGLTCLWQVSGRSEIGFEDWVRMDLWYVRNQSFWTDCVLLLRTPWSVLAGRGAY